MFGGGWRQSGILAAAALHALDTTFPDQIRQTHMLAQHLHQGMRAIMPNVKTIYPVETNMIFLDLSDVYTKSKKKVDVPMLTKHLARHNIRIGGYDTAGMVLRLVVHYQVNQTDIDQVLKHVRDVISQ